MRHYLIIALPFLFLLACGNTEDPTPTTTSSVVLQTEGTPTSTPFPSMQCIGGDVVRVGEVLQCRPYTPQPQIIIATATPAPPQSTPESAVQPSGSHEPTPTPTLEADPTPEPTPHPTATLSPPPTPVIPPTPPRPTPKPTSRYRAVGAPAELGSDGFVFTGGPQASSLDISFSATIEANRYTNITEIQVWQSLTKDTSEVCSTERPIAFITKPRGGGNIYIPASTPYSWSYCTSEGARPIIYAEKIPWLAAETWTYSERPRGKIYDPYITDIAIHINLRDDRVDDLRYTSSAGYILLIFNNDELLARAWVEDN